MPLPLVLEALVLQVVPLAESDLLVVPGRCGAGSSDVVHHVVVAVAVLPTGPVMELGLEMGPLVLAVSRYPLASALPWVLC